MGIPSYYKKICNSIPGLVSKIRNGIQPSHLWIDFNCIVYHCLRRPGAKQYQGEETRVEWENGLIQDVCKYVKKLVHIVEPTEQVFLGVDGVVPMAKMRQQRLRRFKSHWVASEEIRIGKSDGRPRWDTNSITPGTAFMDRLGLALKGLHSGTIQWVISAADEPGEGEHKIVKEIRSCKTKKSHVIYGLDADLILLSLLQPIEELWLFREAIEYGTVQYTPSDEEEYRYFSIHMLRNYLSNGKNQDYILEYCMAMSFLGNDFLPHGISLKLKDNGHDILVEILDHVHTIAGPLINTSTNSWNLNAVKECIRCFKDNEETWVYKHCIGKIKQRYQQARGSTPLEIAYDTWNKTPLRICEELSLVSAIKQNDTNRQSFVLSNSWKTIYNERYLGLQSSDCVDTIVKQYCIGLDWILQYYTGQSVDREWCFPWFLPPLWSDINQWLETQTSMPKSMAPSTQPQIEPQQQLALVLPLQSWWLIRDKKLRNLPKKAPQLWPSSFTLFTCSHKLMWECEAQIPLFMPERLRYYLEEGLL